MMPANWAPASTERMTHSGLSLTVRLMMTGLRTWFSICW